MYIYSLLYIPSYARFIPIESECIMWYKPNDKQSHQITMTGVILHHPIEDSFLFIGCYHGVTSFMVVFHQPVIDLTQLHTEKVARRRGVNPHSRRVHGLRVQSWPPTLELVGPLENRGGDFLEKNAGHLSWTSMITKHNHNYCCYWNWYWYCY